MDNDLMEPDFIEEGALGAKNGFLSKLKSDSLVFKLNKLPVSSLLFTPEIELSRCWFPVVIDLVRSVLD
jgi:hypothetical protein